MEQISTLLPEGYDPNAQVDTEGYLGDAVKKAIANSAALGLMYVTRGRLIGPPGIATALAYRTAGQTDNSDYLEEPYYDDFKSLGGSDDEYSLMKELYKTQDEHYTKGNALLAEVMKGLMSE